ncbi:MAG: sensor histidine kinase [Hyphomicrobiaceae bacterium]
MTSEIASFVAGVRTWIDRLASAPAHLTASARRTNDLASGRPLVAHAIASLIACGALVSQLGGVAAPPLPHLIVSGFVSLWAALALTSAFGGRSAISNVMTTAASLVLVTYVAAHTSGLSSPLVIWIPLILLEFVGTGARRSWTIAAGLGVAAVMALTLIGPALVATPATTMPALALVSTLGALACALALAVPATRRQPSSHALTPPANSAPPAATTAEQTLHLARMSHELRTPLNAIVGFAELMHRDLALKPDELRNAEYSRIIRESSQHVLAIANDLLDHSRLEAGSVSLCRETCHLEPIVQGAIDTVGPIAAARSITISHLRRPTLPTVTADKRAVLQMLLNLLSNAIKFSETGGRIDVVMRTSGAMIEIAVRDRGIGMAADDVRKIGTAYLQTDASRRDGRDGAGLGLSVVKGLVELHGGRLVIASRPGLGTIATLSLPVDTEQQSESATQPLRTAA